MYVPLIDVTSRHSCCLLTEIGDCGEFGWSIDCCDPLQDCIVTELTNDICT